MMTDGGNRLCDSLACVDSIQEQAGVFLEHSDDVSAHAEAASAIESFLFRCDDLLPVKDSEAMWWTGLVGAVVVCAFLSCCILDTRCRNWIFHHLKQVAIGVFLAGVLVYGAGFNDEGSRNNVLVLLLRACVSSLEMFVSESELIEVKHSLKDSATYMIIFSLVHFAAVFVSAIFILRLFGLQLLSMLRLWWYGRKPGNGPLYVFWGIDEHALTVAESIGEEQARLVFVKLPAERHAHSSRFTFSHFFHTSGEGIENYLDRIEALNRGKNKAFLTVADKGLNGNLDTTEQADDLFVQLGLRSLQRMLRKSRRTESMEFFFLSDDEKRNIGAVSMLKFFALKEGKNPASAAARRITVYCHARKNRFNESVLSRPGLEHDVHLVDSSMLSVLQLKENGKRMRDYGKNHPVNFVDYDGNTGTVSSAFTALIVGFGETGRDAFRFLYEFSAFVRTSVKQEGGRVAVTEQERNIYVVDKHLKELKTRFLVNTPALVNNPSIHWLDDMSTRSMAFWDKLKEIIDALNYVVVSVDDDEEAASIAMHLFDFAYRYRKDFKSFRIYVRLRNDISKRLMKQVDRYKVLVDGKPVDVIEVFGTDKGVLAYENLAAVSKERNAKDFYLRYSEICRKIEGDASVETLNADMLWKKRRDSKGKNLNALDNELWIFYQEEQDRSNVCHIYTKLVLAGAVGENGLVSGRLDTLEKLIAGNGAQDEGVDESLIDNLVYTEHIRWNAKMELLGFVPGREKSMKERIHPCLMPCSELIASQDEAIRRTLLYDRGIVELSIKKGKEWNALHLKHD